MSALAFYYNTSNKNSVPFMAQLTSSHIIKYMFMKKKLTARGQNCVHYLFTHFYKADQMNLTANYTKLYQHGIHYFLSRIFLSEN